MNINTLEKIFIDESSWYLYRAPYDGNSYFYYDEMSCELGIMNVDGTIEAKLVKGAEGERFSVCSFSCDGLLYRRSIRYEDEEAGTYFMNLDTGEVIDISEEARLYSLSAYDGYYDMFIGCKESYLVYAAYTKDKILGEAMVR